MYVSKRGVHNWGKCLSKRQAKTCKGTVSHMALVITFNKKITHTPVIRIAYIKCFSGFVRIITWMYFVVFEKFVLFLLYMPYCMLQVEVKSGRWNKMASRWNGTVYLIVISFLFVFFMIFWCLLCVSLQ